MKIKALLFGISLAAVTPFSQAAQIEINQSNSFETNGLQWLNLTVTRALSWGDIEAAIAGTHDDDPTNGHNIRPVDAATGNFISLEGWTFATGEQWAQMASAHISNYEYTTGDPLPTMSHVNDSVYDLSPLLNEVGDLAHYVIPHVYGKSGTGFSRGILADEDQFGRRLIATIREGDQVGQIPSVDDLDTEFIHTAPDFAHVVTGSYLVRDVSAVPLPAAGYLYPPLQAWWDDVN